MTLRRLAFITFAGAGWICAGILGFLLYALLDRSWDDPISLAGRHTNELLALHERQDQTEEVLAWLTQYHGEAPGHQIMTSFVRWATANQAPAEALLNRLQSDPKMMLRLAFAVTDSGQTESFCSAFAQSGVPAVKAVIAEIRNLKSTCG